MNEQQLADLFSEQLDHLLQGEASMLPPEAGELQELLEIIGQPISQVQFQASPTAQAAFQSQLTGWFGPANGGVPMTILGLTKAWFVTILITIITVGLGGGFVALIITSILIFGPVSQVPASPTPNGTVAATVSATPVVSPTGTVTATVVATTTPQPTVTSTVVISGTPVVIIPGQFPTLIFVNHLQLISLCQGFYITQQTLVNYGQAPVTNGALDWEVIEGDDLVDQVIFNSPDLEGNDDDDATPTGVTDDAPIPSESYFQPIPAGQKVKVDIKVKVKDNWWKQENGTEIKVKISIKGKGAPHASHHHQIVTIVKQGAQWVTLKGFAHVHGNNTLLVDGNTVTINSCTGLPPTLPPGAQVEIIGILQPDGTFIAINIIVININIVIDMDSGVPTGGSSGDDDGGSKGGGSKGGGKGGSKGGGKGGSKGGGKGGSGGS
jgi:uncharacterized membrane protein YgcG